MAQSRKLTYHSSGDGKFNPVYYFKMNYKKLPTTELDIYKCKLLTTFEDVNNRIRKVSVGDRTIGKPEKVVMILGATGSGKTTLINGVINYIMGIKWEDDFRLKLIEEKVPGQVQNQAKSQTQWITAYTIHHQPWFIVPYTLTIVDTPGFGDTGGPDRDKEITEQIRQFFTRKGEQGIDQIDAVGFVASSSAPRLTKTQEYIFESILALFGKDIKGNIFMLLTFADGQKPQVLASIEEAKTPYQEFFKFNNSALYTSSCDATSPDDMESFDKLFWRMGLQSFKLFTTHLDQVESISLSLTQDVLKERRALEIIIENIHNNIKLMLNYLGQLSTEQQVLAVHESDIDRNKDFIYKVNELKVERQPIPRGQNTTNCIKCNVTCHDRCRIGSDSLKRLCWSMEWSGNCRICPGKCSWKTHRNQNFTFVVTQMEVTKNSEDLKKKYEDAKGKSMKASEMIAKCKQDITDTEDETLSLIQQASQCISRLEEIALRPNVVATADYIEILIESEKTTYSEGYMERIKHLKELQQRAKYLRKIDETAKEALKVKTPNYIKSLFRSFICSGSSAVNPISLV